MTQPLPIRSINHVARLTKNLEASRAFYRDVLGFREIRRPAFSFAGAWLYNYGLQIHLIVNPEIGEATGTIQTRDNHVAFEVQDTSDLAEVERLLAAHGVPYRSNIQEGTGCKQIFFRDPDGHHVEVAVYPPPVFLDE
jgi:catechol 2,3-dioxygenase-like lactoylglutathione lyase family enzyme